MKIAISSNGSTLDDQVEARLGRCPYFIFVNSDTLEFESIPNPNMSLGGGAEPQSAQMMAEKGISVVLTGNCGPNAIQTFGAAGLGRGRGMGDGRGGRGMGGCGDSRLSADMAGKELASSKASQTNALSRQEETGRLKQTAQDLRRQLADIEGRLDDLIDNKSVNLSVQGSKST
jgi:predicted Fe-Mo cluster-binding NifX family protein